MYKPLFVLCLLLIVTAASAGRSITVSLGFSYYKDRSPQSIAEEISVNGFDDVRLISASSSQIDDGLLKAFHSLGIRVWCATFCNGFYPPADLPKDWQSWQMKMRHPAQPDGFVALCPNNPKYRAWKKTAVVTALKQHRFDGIDLMEPFLPAYAGPTNEHYGCLCDCCAAAFKAMYPEAAGIPDFENPESPHYWKTDKGLYRKWVDFRVSTVVGFLDELINGKGGVREICPAVRVATWSLGCSMPDQITNLREWEAVDGAAIVARVKPDLHVIQTDWPDWMKPDLPSTYPSGYKPVLESIHAVAPKLPMMLQADIGSKQQNIRSREWSASVERCAKQTGFVSTTSYEYFIGGYMYTEPPAIVKAEREAGGIRLVWNKRIDSKSGANVENYALNSGRVTSARVDGNIVHLSVPGTEGGFVLTVSGILDDAARRLYGDKPPCAMNAPARIQIR